MGRRTVIFTRNETPNPWANARHNLEACANAIEFHLIREDGSIIEAPTPAPFETNDEFWSGVKYGTFENDETRAADASDPRRPAWALVAPGDAATAIECVREWEVGAGVPVIVVGEKVRDSDRRRAWELGADAAAKPSQILNSAEHFAWIGTHPATAKPLPEGIQRGIEIFNRGEFYEAHDHFEAVWRETRPCVRRLYQGLLQLGIAYHQIRRENWHGAQMMIASAILRLRQFWPACQGIAVAPLVTAAEFSAAQLKALGRDRIADYPRDTFCRITFTA